MQDNNKMIETIPDEFSSYEEAIEFWDQHDTTNYLDLLEPVEIIAELRHRHYEVELDGDVIAVLKQQAQERGVPISLLASELLRKQLVLAG